VVVAPGEGAPWASGVVAELSGLLLGEQTVSDLLELVVQVAVVAGEAITGASVSLVVASGARLETVNASSPVIRAVDEVQYEGGSGPCVEAIRTGRETLFGLPGGRWAAFSEAAAAAGIGAVWSLPLVVRDRPMGALNLYSSEDAPWRAGNAGVQRALAAQAAVVLANAAALTSAELKSRHLEEALETRDVIGQAKGILMAREDIDGDAAFDMLRRASRRSNRKLRDVAGDVVAPLDRRARKES
jgi:GAF domain-containing protein